VTDEVVVAIELADLFEDGLQDCEAIGRASGPKLSTFHWHRKNSPRMELYGYFELSETKFVPCRPCLSGKLAQYCEGLTITFKSFVYQNRMTEVSIEIGRKHLLAFYLEDLLTLRYCRLDLRYVSLPDKVIWSVQILPISVINKL
jgi:hypothetical protein